MLRRLKYDMTAGSWQEKVEQVYIKSKRGHTILLDTYVGHSNMVDHYILEICFDLLFQMLNMPSKYVKFWNLGPF